jgi:hypothetical protein
MGLGGRKVCVFITAEPIAELMVMSFICSCRKKNRSQAPYTCSRGGRGIVEDTCRSTRDDEPRPVWTILPITHWLTFGPYPAAGPRSPVRDGKTLE